MDRDNNNRSHSIIMSLKDITFGYIPHKPVVEGINLDVPKGGFFGLLGPSGSGKSTLLKIIIGLHRPWRGLIKFDSDSKSNSSSSPIITNYYNNNASFRIGYVPQVESVDWNFPVTVTEVVGMGIWNRSGNYPWFNRKAREKVQYTLDILGIGDYASRQIRELSGGEQQRVFLARALIGDPEILILDEPTSGVDYNTSKKILAILTELNQKGKTIILTTHDIVGIGKRLPWIVCINKSIISQGTPKETLTSTILLKTYGLASIDEQNNSHNSNDNLLTERIEFQNNMITEDD